MKQFKESNITDDCNFILSNYIIKSLIFTKNKTFDTLKKKLFF